MLERENSEKNKIKFFTESSCLKIVSKCVITITFHGSIGTITPGTSNINRAAGYYNAFTVAGSSNSTGGKGGDGITIFISGVEQSYSGGGGGGRCASNCINGVGGLGGGGDGQSPGVPNTGGGGGGSRGQGGSDEGENGGSGIVIIRYQI